MKVFLFLLVCFECIRTLHCIVRDEDQIRIEGDFTIGAIYPIRSFNGNHMNHKGCGELEPNFVIQSVAFQLAIDYVNEHVLRNYTLGGLVMDECDNANVGLQSAVRMMIEEMGGLDAKHGLQNGFPRPNSNSSFIYGITGGITSIVSTMVVPLLDMFNLPLISNYASSSDFDDASMHPYFLRTVPSDQYQARAVFDILQTMRWYSVLVIIEQTAYGKGLQKEFDKLLDDQRSNHPDDPTHICVVHKAEVSNVAPNFDEFKKNLDISQTRVIVAFLDFTTAEKLFQFMNTSYPNKTFQFVGTDGWSRTRAVNRLERVVQNAITTEFYSYEMPMIREFVDTLTMGKVANSSNPWLKKLVQDRYNCDPTAPRYCAEYPADHAVQLQNIDSGLGRSYYTLEAVYAFAMAIESLRTQYCGLDGGLCPDFFDRSNGSQLYRVLRETRITDPSQLPREFQFFDNSISGPPIYSIYQFRYDPRNQTRTWRPMGNWSLENEDPIELVPQCTLNDGPSAACVIGTSPYMEIGECRPECPKDSRRTRMLTECCWSCEKCNHFEYIKRSNGSESCVECVLGERPNANFDACVPDKLIYPKIDVDQPHFLVCLLVAGIGFALALCACIVFVCFRRTPVVVLASFPLCIVATAALALVFASSILNLMKPSDPVCITRWTVQPFLITTVIGSTFVQVLQTPRDYLDAALARPSCASSIKFNKLLQLIGICMTEVACIVFFACWFRNKEKQQRPTGIGASIDVSLERTDTTTLVSCAAFTDKAQVSTLFAVPFLLLCITLILACRRFKASIVFERSENRRVVWSSTLVFLLFMFAASPLFVTTQGPVCRPITQLIVLILSGLVILSFVYVPLVHVIFRRKHNSWLHLTRDTKEDDRITSDQLIWSDQIRGEGSFCEVHKATYRRNAKQVLDVAAKMVKVRSTNPCIGRADSSEALYQEIMILRHLRESEHVIRLHGVCNDSESTILVLEYFNGGSCSEFIPRHRARLIAADLVSIGICIAEALRFLKEKSIVHRDVKSENCLVREMVHHQPQRNTSGGASIPGRYHAKLADFGLAVEASAGKADRRRMRLVPERHTAPEGFNREFSHESDVWSFGVFLWEIFTLKVSDSATPYASVSTNLGQHIRAGCILDKPLGTPDGIYENVMKRCWMLEPSKRIEIAKVKHVLTSIAKKLYGSRAACDGKRSTNSSISVHGSDPSLSTITSIWTVSSESSTKSSPNVSYYKSPFYNSEDVSSVVGMCAFAYEIPMQLAKSVEDPNEGSGELTK